MERFLLENVICARKRKLYIEEEESEFFEPYRKKRLEVDDELDVDMVLLLTVVLAASTSTQKPRKPRSPNKARNKVWWHEINSAPPDFKKSMRMMVSCSLFCLFSFNLPCLCLHGK